MSQTTFEKFGVHIKKERKKKIIKPTEPKEIVTLVKKEPEIDYQMREWMKLKELHLHYGSTYVYRYNDKILGTGDLKFYEGGSIFNGSECKFREIFKNFFVMRKMLLAKPKLNCIGKSYQADIYENKWTKKEMMEHLHRELGYDKHIYEITEDRILDFEMIDPLHVDKEWEF